MARNAVKVVKGGRPLPAGRTIGPPRTFLPFSLELKCNVDATSSYSARDGHTSAVITPTSLHLSHFPGFASPSIPFAPPSPPLLFHHHPCVCVCQRAAPFPPRIPLPDHRSEIDIRAPGFTALFWSGTDGSPPSFRRERRKRES